MLYRSLKYRKNTETKNPKIAKTNKGKLIILSKCTVCDIKNRDLSKNQKLVV